MSTLRFLLCFNLCLDSFTSLALGADLQAKVIHVTDGDTLIVLIGAKEEIKIRLNGIDCPKKAQAFGNRAKEFTKDLVAGQMVTIQAYELDKHGRTIGDVILEDGRNLNQEFVKAGLAWWYFKYSKDEQLGLVEVQAKIAAVGLWKDRNPIPPWIFRKSEPPFSVLPIEEKVVEEGGGGEQRIQPPICHVPHPPPGEPYPMLGNKNSKKYHRRDCINYCSIWPKTRVPFESPQAEEEAGFEVAGNCPH